jgi:ubiquinone/menaquinone biosynthesis C-methylase UbiE
MPPADDSALAPNTAGLVLHRAARYYDLMAWLMMLGREGAFRQKLVNLARLTPGESVLDVGCGTGTLAVAAKRRVGPRGAVCGIDASPEMIAAAGRKARKAALDIVFRTAVIEGLPFADASFNVVLSTLMFHHLPAKARQEGAHEMRRVLKRGGRVLVVDFSRGDGPKRGLLAHFHHRHGHVKLADVIAALGEAGLNTVESGEVGTKGMIFALAQAPWCE